MRSGRPTIPRIEERTMIEGKKLMPADWAHAALRIMTGAGFFTHGAGKLFGWFGASGTVELASARGAAGVIETFCGAAIMLGLFTRPAAFLASGQMAVAYFWIHYGGEQLFWWQNGGELAMVYSFVFLYLSAVGAGPFSIDAARAGRVDTI